MIFLKVRGHYLSIADQLSLSSYQPVRNRTGSGKLRVVLPISGVHAGMLEAVNVAKSITNNIRAVFIEIIPGSAVSIQEKWNRFFPDIPLVILPSPYRSIVMPLLNYLDQFDQQSNDGQLATVILPELIPAKRWQNLLHNQSARLIKSSLLYRRRNLGFQRVIIDVPFHLKK